jgi:hypothetical protein
LIILFVSMGAIILVENIFGIGMGFTKEIYIPKFGEV